MILENASGNINVEELSEAFKCNLTGNDYWIEIMNEVDANHDGALSLVEFTNMMKKLIV